MGQVIIKEKVFKFLDDLRESGKTNMYGAASYVEVEFGIDRNTAKDLIFEWMEQAQ